MKKIIVGFLICICLMLSCGSSSMSDKSFNKYSSTDSTFISQIIKNSNFKITEITTIDNKIVFYKVFVTSKSNNGNYIHELLVTRYIGFNVTVTELGNYHESCADDIVSN